MVQNPSFRLRIVCQAVAMDFEQQVSDAWASADRENPAPTIEFFEHLLDTGPTDAARLFELASAYDWAAREADAIPLYERAIAAGLDANRDRQARIQYGSSLRNVGRHTDAVAVLEEAHRRYPDSVAVDCFLTLALAGADRPAAAAITAFRAAIHDGDSDLDEYRQALTRYTADLA